VSICNRSQARLVDRGKITIYYAVPLFDALVRYRPVVTLCSAPWGKKKVMSQQNTVWHCDRSVKYLHLVWYLRPRLIIDGIHATTLVLYYTAKNTIIFYTDCIKYHSIFSVPCGTLWPITVTFCQNCAGYKCTDLLTWPLNADISEQKYKHPWSSVCPTASWVKQEIWANVQEARDSISLILYAGCPGRSISNNFGENSL